jgi:hypothetical protein
VCCSPRTFIATTTRATTIIEPFIMKQEKPLRRADKAQRRKKVERKKVGGIYFRPGQ